MPCAKALGQLGAPSVGLRSCVAGALRFTSPRPQRFPASGTQSSSQNPGLNRSPLTPCPCGDEREG